MLIRTLIVEDDPMVARIHQQYLSRLRGFAHVGTARNGAEALGMLTATSPDLVLLDVYLPAHNGLDLLRQLRAADANVDVILITAADDPATVEQAMRLGAVDYILKPFDFERFHQALEAFRRRFALFREHRSLNQDLLDEHVHAWPNAPGPPEDPEFPKGIEPFTLQRILETLEDQATGISAQDVADRLGLSRITARKYLEYLCDRGWAALELRYQDKGRPTKLYTLTASARAPRP
ncbi:response regulator [Alicyclobacillus sp.]|uniref:response regulator n=1 Tax=Alicyclobacillus sp. TaxID=61169 RepID=UPI0025BCAA31|nr:response regulator [Alicyclobacillus sp.]MCL6517438.1 response regulator [Alicyclobacillus sp.]